MQEQTTYTLAQVLFLMTAFFVAPAFGAAGLMLGARIIHPLFRVVVPAMAVIAGLSLAGAVALSMFPEYPYIGPPERHAAALALVGHLGGALALGWLVRARRTGEDRPPRSLWIASGVAWLLASFAAVSVAFATVIPLRLELPDDATRVVEHQASDAMGSDFTYRLEADMSAEGYAAFVERLSLPPTNGTTRELVQDDCGMRTTYESGRMRLETWCQ